MLERVKKLKYYSLFRNILRFEIFYKIVILFLLSPFLRIILQEYLDSVGYGIAFNQDMIYQFLSIQGIIVVLFLFLFMILIIYYEMYVVIQIIAINQKNEVYSLRKIMMKSFLSLKSLHYPSLLCCGVYIVLLLPLVHIGYLNSYIPRWDIPHFIFGELQLTTGGQLLICLVFMIYYGLFIMMIFVPLYMILKQKHFFQAIKGSFCLLKRITINEKVQLFFMLFGWIFIEYCILSMIPYSILHNRDFNWYFIKYVINSASFRYSVIQYVLLYIISIFAMIFFLKSMLSLFMKYEGEVVTVNHLPMNIDKIDNWVRKGQSFLKTIYQSFQERVSHFKIYQQHKRISKIIIGIIILCLMSLYLHQDALVHKPWVIGHRGSGYYVENTYEAVKDAHESGADYAEIDIQLSQDGIPMVFHDVSLSRLSDVDKKVSDMKASELEAVTLSQNNKESHMLTLEHLIKKMQEDKLTVGLLIELKPSGDGEEMARKIIEIIEKYNFARQAIFMSLDYNSVQILTQERPQWWVGYCIYGSVGDIDKTILELDIDFLAMEENRASKAMIQKGTKHMLPVYIWTVDSSKKMKQYLDMGVCGLITNYPDIGRKAVDKYKKDNPHYYYYNGNGYPQQP